MIMDRKAARCYCIKTVEIEFINGDKNQTFGLDCYTISNLLSHESTSSER